MMKRNKGFTLIEILMVISVIALISIGAFTFFTQAMDSARSSQAKQSVNGLIVSVRDLYQGQPDYSDLDTQTVIDAGIVPSSWAVNNGDIENNFGGPVEVNVASDDASRFTITFGGVPETACVEIATMNTNIESVTIGGGDEITTIPAPVSDATSDCSGEDNEIIFEST